MQSTTTEQKRFLTVAEVAAELRLTAMTIYDMIRRGKIPATRIGGAIRIDRDNFNSWLKERTHGL